MKSIFKTVLFSIPVGITIVDVVGYVARVDGVSMFPTLNPNKNQTEYVFLNKVRKFSIIFHFIILLIKFIF
jgi:mitochondrial inner membrane protease subunit 2